MMSHLSKIAAVLFISLGSNALIAQQHLTIINAAGLGAEIVEDVRLHAQRELYVQAESTNILSETGQTGLDICKKISKENKAFDDYFIVLGLTSENLDLHYVVITNEQVAIINVQAVTSCEPTIFSRRLKRLTLRAAAALLGITSDPDPFSVMHDYETVEDLDHIGMNFSPPWGEKFRQAAMARGFNVRPLFPSRSLIARKPLLSPASSTNRLPNAALSAPALIRE